MITKSKVVINFLSCGFLLVNFNNTFWDLVRIPICPSDIFPKGRVFLFIFGSLADQKLMNNVYFRVYGGYPYTTLASIKYLYSSSTSITVASSANVEIIVYQVNNIYNSIDEYIISYNKEEIEKYKALINKYKQSLEEDEVTEDEITKIKELILIYMNRIDKKEGKLFTLEF